MNSYPRELVETPRPLVLVLSEEQEGERLISQLKECALPEGAPDLRYVTKPYAHEVPRKSDPRSRAPDGRPLEAYLTRGVLKSSWLKKQCAELPSVVVLVKRVERFWNKSEANAEEDAICGRCEQLKAALAARDVRLVLVVVSSDSRRLTPTNSSNDLTAESEESAGAEIYPLAKHDPIEDERVVVGLRKKCGLGSACVYALRDSCEENSSKKLPRMARTVAELSAGYYLGRARRIKKWDKTLTSRAPLLARYAFKVGWYYECRGRNADKALYHYETAYSAVADLMRSGVGLAFEAPNQVLAVADWCNFKVCKLSLEAGRVEGAAHQIQRHLTTFRVAPRGLSQQDHSGWLSRQHLVFAQLLELHLAGLDLASLSLSASEFEAAASLNYAANASFPKLRLDNRCLQTTKGTQVAAFPPKATNTLLSKHGVLSYAEPLYHFSSAAAHALRRLDSLESTAPDPRFPKDKLERIVFKEPEFLGEMPELSAPFTLGDASQRAALGRPALEFASRCLDHLGTVSLLLKEALRCSEENSVVVVTPALLSLSLFGFDNHRCSRKSAWLHGALGEVLARSDKQKEAAEHLCRSLACQKNWPLPRSRLLLCLFQCASRLGARALALECSLEIARPELALHMPAGRSTAAQRDAFKLLSDSPPLVDDAETTQLRGFSAYPGGFQQEAAKYVARQHELRDSALVSWTVTFLKQDDDGKIPFELRLEHRFPEAVNVSEVILTLSGCQPVTFAAASPLEPGAVLRWVGNASSSVSDEEDLVISPESTELRFADGMSLVVPPNDEDEAFYRVPPPRHARPPRLGLLISDEPALSGAPFQVALTLLREEGDVEERQWTIAIRCDTAAHVTSNDLAVTQKTQREGAYWTTLLLFLATSSSAMTTANLELRIEGESQVSMEAWVMKETDVAKATFRCIAPFSTTIALLPIRRPRSYGCFDETTGDLRWIRTGEDEDEEEEECVAGVLRPMRLVIRGACSLTIHSVTYEDKVLEHSSSQELAIGDEFAVLFAASEKASPLTVEWSTASSRKIQTVVKVQPPPRSVVPAFSTKSSRVGCDIHLATPFTVRHAVTNHTSRALRLRCTASDAQAFAVGGRGDAELHLAAKETIDLDFVLVPLMTGRRALPRLEFKQGTETPAATLPPLLVFVNP